MNWKFKKDDIIAWHNLLSGDPIMIAKIKAIDPCFKQTPQYHLSYLDNSSGWHEKGSIEKSYRILGWNMKFFDLFMI